MNDGYVPVVGFEKYYLVNKCGSIISLRNKNGKRGKELKQYKDKDGYMRVKLYGDNKSIWIGVHKVVAKVKEKQQVDINGNMRLRR